ncbi:MAG: hypothetical protein KDA96_14175 [Planctomycetaceae bacterium]|nr:hypothetical protein [Planctomycetaceae bacterium]
MSAVPSSRRSISFRTVFGIQVIFVAAFVVAWFALPPTSQKMVVARATHQPYPLDVQIEDIPPVTISSLYNDPDLVTDQQLADVLHKILPRFSRRHLRPNYVEHALRTWGASIEFRNPDVISGPQMRDFLIDNSRYVDSWGEDGMPILEPYENGISIRYGKDRSTSVHHDHLLACLTEAGVPLSEAVHVPGREMQMYDVMNQSLQDFQLDEIETEWSAMAFSAWLMPQKLKTWHNGRGRQLSLDLLAERLIRNHKQHGVCSGTHRVYTLMMMLRLNEDNGGELLSEHSTSRMMDYLREVRDLIMAAQDDDGSWPPNWASGADAAKLAEANEPIYRRVISTGHHLEWLSIAPEELHPPREDIHRAATWIINNTLETPQETIDSNYTFYSHVGNALALWRKTTPAAFWQNWRNDHPEAEQFETPLAEDSAEASH